MDITLKNNMVYKRRIIRCILLICVPLIVLLLTWKYNTICFETNDDYFLMSIVAGFKTGKPSPNMMFCNIIWGWIISSLYRITQVIPWYTISFLLIIYTSLIIIYDVCLHAFENQIIKGTITFVFLYLCILCWYTTILQFTTIPAYAGIAALLLMIKEEIEPSEKIVDFRYIAFIILSLCAVLLRSDVSYLFTLALILYGLCLKFGYSIKTDKYIFTGVTIQVITWLVNLIYNQVTEWGDYWAYNAVRAQWADHPGLTFVDNPQIYSSVGWTEKFYNLATSWFYLDEHFTKEALTTITEAYSTNTNLLNGYSITDLFMSVLCAGVTGFKIAIGLLMLFIITKTIYAKAIKDFLTIVFFSIITTMLLFYLAISGRLIFRVQFTIMIIFLLPAIFIVLIRKYDGTTNILYRVFVNGLATVVAAFVIIISLTTESGLYRNMAEYSKWHTGQQTTVYYANELAMEFPNSYFIYDFNLALAGSPFLTYPGKKPCNMQYWGGWETYSPIDKQQLIVNGFQNMYPEDFFNERVFFISLINSTQIQDLLVPYMEERYPGCYLEQILQNERFIVYQFRR